MWLEKTPDMPVEAFHRSTVLKCRAKRAAKLAEIFVKWVNASSTGGSSSGALRKIRLEAFDRLVYLKKIE
ncbi:hypothetical protein [Hydrogeniiclostridium mannosilyticum]|uniref:hypothetical protein n=1 Tax=Hydrogeniiclostridium mannosilyticum TaxID=2764322 RepID=UPI00399A20D2